MTYEVLARAGRVGALPLRGVGWAHRRARAAPVQVWEEEKEWVALVFDGLRLRQSRATHP